MGYELVEQLGSVPGNDRLSNRRRHRAGRDVESLRGARTAWLDRRRAARDGRVQAEGCAPIVRAFSSAVKQTAARVEGGATKMWGLRVPGGIGDRLTLRALRESHGYALAVSDEAAADAMHDLHRHEGIDATEEGGATLAALRSWLERRRASRSDRALQYRNFVEVRSSSLGRRRLTAGNRRRVEVIPPPVTVCDDLTAHRYSSGRFVAQGRRIVNNHRAVGLLKRYQVTLYDRDRAGDDLVFVVCAGTGAIGNPGVAVPGAARGVNVGRRRCPRRRRSLGTCYGAGCSDGGQSNVKQRYCFHASLFPSLGVVMRSKRSSKAAKRAGGRRPTASARQVRTAASSGWPPVPAMR